MFKSATMPIKSIISDQDMQPNELEYSLQEFIVNRMEDSEPLENIEELLKEKCDEILIESIKDAVIDREIKLSYNQYKQGLFDGIKMALILKKRIWIHLFNIRKIILKK